MRLVEDAHWLGLFSLIMKGVVMTWHRHVVWSLIKGQVYTAASTWIIIAPATCIIPLQLKGGMCHNVAHTTLWLQGMVEKLCERLKINQSRNKIINQSDVDFLIKYFFRVDSGCKLCVGNSNPTLIKIDWWNTTLTGRHHDHNIHVYYGVFIPKLFSVTTIRFYVRGILV